MHHEYNLVSLNNSSLSCAITLRLTVERAAQRWAWKRFPVVVRAESLAGLRKGDVELLVEPRDHSLVGLLKKERQSFVFLLTAKPGKRTRSHLHLDEEIAALDLGHEDLASSGSTGDVRARVIVRGSVDS